MIASARGDSRTRLAVLVAAIVASSMSYIDITALTVALPAIKARLGASDAQAQWITEAYLLFLSALILIGGALGDRFGRRRLFLSGVWIFGASSAACALAPDPGFLIAARCIQGVGAALMIPESLALITAAYAPSDRGRAIGLWSAASAVTMAIGPVLGGWVTQAWSWRWVFWINVPLAIVALLFAYLGVPESRAENGGGKPDIAGSALITLALALVVAFLMQLQHPAGDAIVPVLAVAACALLAAFVVAERRAESPVVPLRLFESRRFTVAGVYALLFSPPSAESCSSSRSSCSTSCCIRRWRGARALADDRDHCGRLSLSGAFATQSASAFPLIAGGGITALGLLLLARLGWAGPTKPPCCPRRSCSVSESRWPCRRW